MSLDSADLLDTDDDDDYDTDVLSPRGGEAPDDPDRESRLLTDLTVAVESSADPEVVTQNILRIIHHSYDGVAGPDSQSNPATPSPRARPASGRSSSKESRPRTAESRRSKSRPGTASSRSSPVKGRGKGKGKSRHGSRGASGDMIGGGRAYMTPLTLGKSYDPESSPGRVTPRRRRGKKNGT
eukprot:TRINITY_DN3674_c3_g1_i1.p1 TRINITY_DN3674_c3_g1~~TRINITY_DN3674_c3_g1_i1.p1  ORF type:complete len:205 (-),score=23.30 TRINITY_DN3674_c3_g1_i1:54-602(-)